jgi:hypothetical protein
MLTGSERQGDKCKDGPYYEKKEAADDRASRKRLIGSPMIAQLVLSYYALGH